MHSGDLNTKLVRYLNCQKEVGCQMVPYSNAIWILDSATIWIPDKWMSSCFLRYWSGIWTQTSKSLVFKCFQYSYSRYSDPHCIRFCSNSWGQFIIFQIISSLWKNLMWYIRKVKFNFWVLLLPPSIFLAYK